MGLKKNPKLRDIYYTCSGVHSYMYHGYICTTHVVHRYPYLHVFMTYVCVYYVLPGTVPYRVIRDVYTFFYSSEYFLAAV